MTWFNWWIPEFLISALLWLGLAPLLGALFIKKLGANVSEYRGNLEFVLGAALLSLAASTFVFLHQVGLVLFFAAFIYLKFVKKQKTEFKFQYLDFIIAIPVGIAIALHPVAIDSNLSELQFSLMKDFWPIDWLHRLDFHVSVSLVVGFWFKHVPIINSLSVQGCFYALLVWRVLLCTYSFMKKSDSRWWGEVLLAITFMGSLYYRKQIHVKASPIGPIFLILALVSLVNKKVKFHPVVWGLLFASAFNFGEYGGLLLVFMTPFILISGEGGKNFIASWPWIILFTAPEVIKKALIFSNGSAYVAAFAAAVLTVAFFVFKKVKIKKILDLSYLFSHIAFLFLILATVVNFIARPQNTGASNVSFWQWSLGCNGLLFLFSLLYLYKNKNEESAKQLSIFAAVQFIFFSLWLLFEVLGLERFNPSQLWWNLSKNATMITLPLLTTICGSLLVSEFFKRSKNPLIVCIAGFFMFLQDPIVKRVIDGPLAPHAPRLSAYQSLFEMYWENAHNPHFVSRSGNIILHRAALPEPDIVEHLFEWQRRSSKRLKVCFPKMLQKTSAAFGIEAYTFDSAVGVRGYYQCEATHDFELIPISQNCKGEVVTRSETARLCKNI